jgi:hypothetical protein
MGRWRDSWWFGAAALAVVLAGYLYMTHQGPFQQCVTTGSGSQFCGEAAKAYCSGSESMNGHSVPCDTLLGSKGRAVTGAPPTPGATVRAGSGSGAPTGYAPAGSAAGTSVGYGSAGSAAGAVPATAAPAAGGAGGDCVAAISC